MKTIVTTSLSFIIMSLMTGAHAETRTGSAVAPEISSPDKATKLAPAYTVAQKGDSDTPDQVTEEPKSKQARKVMVVQTDIEDVASNAIAIGYPEGVHAVFDTTLVRFLAVWRGDFLDAETGSVKPFPSDLTVPVSDDRWGYPPVMPFSAGDDPRVKWPETQGAEAGYTYKGVRIDPDGTPVVMYAFGGMDIEERFEPFDGDNGFRRKFRITGASRPFRFLPVVGAHIDPIEDGFEVNAGWETRIEVPESTSEVVSIGGGWAALIYVFAPTDDPIEITQEATW